MTIDTPDQAQASQEALVNRLLDDTVASMETFSVYLGLFMWGGLWLRDPALRTLFPWRRHAQG